MTKHFHNLLKPRSGGNAKKISLNNSNPSFNLVKVISKELIQATLAICGFAIRGFAIRGLIFVSKKLLSVGFPSIIRGFSYLLL